VTGSARRLCALAALFAPERAPSLVSRLAGATPEAAREAERLVASARRERLRALGEALALAGPDAGMFAARESAPVAMVMRAVASGLPAGDASPVLVRLCRERLGR